LSSIKTRDIIILDEPTEGFSEFQLDKLRDVLQELDVGQLIIVSHEQKVEGFVDSVVKLRKEAGNSSIDKPVL
jgi:DNA repair exonuclease SbcCD ATPase subunit